MRIRVFIHSDIDAEEINIENNTICFYFKSVESYKEFRFNFSLSKIFKDNYNENMSFSNALGSINLSRFKKIFKRTKPILRYHSESLETIDIPIIVDLSYLPFTEKISILTNPLVSDKNLFFMDEYTTGEYITLKEMINMYQAIIIDVEFIIENNYSETEAIYYIYQKYKERIYKKEGKKDKCSISRSLNQIIKRDNIVCVGYSNYLNAIASILNLNVFPLSWNDETNINSGHQENIAIINDYKYGIKGVFAIDITWDSKRSEEDETYQNNISHFLVPMAFDEIEKKHKGLVVPADMLYHSIFNRYKRLQFFIKSNSLEFIIDDSKKLVIKNINQLYQILDIPPITLECNIEEEIAKVKSLGKVIITPETLKNIINNVTPRSEDSLDNMIKSSYHYRHYQASIAQAKLLKAILGTKK